MRFHYGIDLVDVIEGRGPSPALVMLLVKRLPDTSLTIALANGGPDHFGWGVDRHIAADTFDALNQNTRATGQWKKGSVPKFPAWPRPKSKAKGEKKKKAGVTVADLYKKFTGR